MNRLRIWMSLTLLCFISGALLATAGESPRLRVLCLASEDTAKQGLDSIDPEVVTAFAGQGIDLHFQYYQKTSLAEMSQYAVVVGMIPQLFCGTRAIDARLGRDFDAFLAGGGGIVMIPAPSYYATEDFVRQLNPWLGQHGVELLSEIPLDLQNQKEIVRILAYRFLRTGNIRRDHPVTANIPQVWLPLDFSNHYVVSYTMNVSPDWQVLIRGEKSCASYPFRSLSRNIQQPGTWRSEPPFLAVRDIGKGRMAVFTTSSGYFLYDAFHWSQGSGFVMREGNGLPLLCNLFQYVAQNSRPVSPAVLTVQPDAPSVVPGNVPVMPDSLNWLNHVLAQKCPQGYGVRYYIDCGAVADLPYTSQRGRGYLNGQESWLVRWPWAEIFHATASNARACDKKVFRYRFDRLNPGKRYQLGVMVWSYQKEGGRDLKISVVDQELARLRLPHFNRQQGPFFTLLPLPQQAVQDQMLTLAFQCAEDGDGSFTSVAELWLFEEGAPKTSAAALASRFSSPVERNCELLYPKEYFSGLIGARSNLTTGENTVADLSAAAKQQGLRFLVFTDELERLDSQGMSKLREACQSASDSTFTAIPGGSLTAKYSLKPQRADDPQLRGDINAYFIGGIERLPTAEDRKNPYELFWKFLGGEYCGGSGIPANLPAPAEGQIAPFFQRFWRGFDLITYNQEGTIAADSRELYSDVLASGYGPFPRASGNYRSVAAVRRAAASGWKVSVLAEDQKQLVPCLYSTSATSGPEIRQLAYSFDHMRDGENAGGILFRNRTWLIAHLNVRHTAALTEITLYKGQQPVRTWRPKTGQFEIHEPVLIAEQCELSWRILAADGTEARSGRFQCQDSGFLAGMCSDNQNSICSVTVQPSRFQRDERELYFQHSYWHTGENCGQLGVMRDARELVPRISEIGIIQICKYLRAGPELLLADGTTENHLYAAMRIESASRAFNRTTYEFSVAGSALRSRSEITAFLPVVHGATAVLVENTIAACRDLPAAEWTGLRALRIGMMPALPPLWNYSHLESDGNWRGGNFSALKEGQVERGKLSHTRGAVALWPNDFANLLVFPLDGQPYQVEFENQQKVWNARETVGIRLPSRDWKQGEEIRTRFLIMLYPRKIGGGDSLSTEALKSVGDEIENIRREYVERQGLLSKIHSGLLRSSNYTLDFEPERESGAVLFDSTVPAQMEPVPVRVCGMNPKWTCGIWKNGDFQHFSSVRGVMHAVLTAGESASVAAGHPLRASCENMIVEYDSVWQGGIRTRVHNPGLQPVDAVLTSNSLMAGLPACAAAIHLAPGESKWLWLRGIVSIEEKAGQVVDTVEDKNGILTLYFLDGRKVVAGIKAP